MKFFWNRYAYNSTLKKKGGNEKDKWFSIRGVLLLKDGSGMPYILFETRKPGENNAFEYGLLEYRGSDRWGGDIFNVIHLNDNPVKMHRISLEKEYEIEEVVDSTIINETARVFVSYPVDSI